LPQTLKDGSAVTANATQMVNWNARNFFRGPGLWNQDLSVFKNFDLTERVKLRFSADFFNAFNHPNDVAPDSYSGLQDLSLQANDPRIIQFSLHLQW
jgi:hypothetical protein